MSSPQLNRVKVELHMKRGLAVRVICDLVTDRAQLAHVRMPSFASAWADRVLTGRFRFLRRVAVARVLPIRGDVEEMGFECYRNGSGVILMQHIMVWRRSLLCAPRWHAADTP